MHWHLEESQSHRGRKDSVPKFETNDRSRSEFGQILIIRKIDSQQFQIVDECAERLSDEQTVNLIQDLDSIYHWNEKRI